jgi:hypothetical protein
VTIQELVSLPSPGSGLWFLLSISILETGHARPRGSTDPTIVISNSNINNNIKQQQCPIVVPFASKTRTSRSAPVAEVCVVLLTSFPFRQATVLEEDDLFMRGREVLGERRGIPQDRLGERLEELGERSEIGLFMLKILKALRPLGWESAAVPEGGRMKSR